MPELNDKAIQELVKLGALPGTPRTVDGGTVPYVVIPEGFKVSPLGEMIYNSHRVAPERVSQNVKVLDVPSFIEYYTLFSDPNSRVFAWEPGISVTAVLDYHGAKEGSPRWGSHTVKLELKHSPEWTRWLGNNNKSQSQQDFAEFLEQNGIDISSPSPASMMEVARDLQGTTEVQFGAGIRMQDGSIRFKYTEETKGTVGGDQVSVPERFTLSIPIFVGGTRVPLDALLRYRVKEGRLNLWYTLIRPEEALRQAFLAARDAIAETLQVNVINGQI